MLKTEGPRCLIIGEEDSVDLILRIFERLKFFGGISITEDASQGKCSLEDYDYIVLTDPESEFLFFGSSDTPWVIVLHPDYDYKFIPKKRILTMPRIDDVSNTKQMRHLKKMLAQASNGDR